MAQSMVKYSALINLFVCLNIGRLHAQNKDIDIVYHHLYTKLTNDKLNYSVIDSLKKGIQKDGSWKDIDYKSRSVVNWPPIKHLERALLLSKAYSTKVSPYYNDNSLRDQIIAALQYWKKNPPICDNPFYQGIRSPETFIEALFFLKGKISKDLLLSLSDYVIDIIDHYKDQAGNLIWVARYNIIKGATIDDDALITKAVNACASTLRIKETEGEDGIKVDGSYHQHGSQMYMGAYGLSFIIDVMENLDVIYGTKYAAAYTKEKLAILGNMVLQGTERLTFRKTIDFSTVGRNITRKDNTRGISVETLDKLAIYDSASAKEYKDYKDFVNGLPFKHQGAKYFFKSDMLTKNGSNYYLSVKMISSRTRGTEMINQEGIKSFYLPLGATNLYTSGNEYFNIQPSWDWTRIPGVTAESSLTLPELPTYVPMGKTNYFRFMIGTNDFAGGVSNGNDGICAFDGNYNGITARKAYFIFGDAMMCLGMGINAMKPDKITTSVNQCFTNGTISAFDGNKITHLSQSQDAYTYNNNLKWVYHDNIGYIFPDGGNINVLNNTQSGSWHDINLGADATSVTNNVFSIYFNHTNNPSNATYQYIVVPAQTLNSFQQVFTAHGFVVVANNGDIQAVKNTNAREYGVVFYKPGTIDFGNSFTLSLDKEAIVVITVKGDNYQISVADPTYKATTIMLTINKKVKGGNSIINSNFSSMEFKMPQGDLKGSTVTGDYKVEAF